MNNTKNYPSWLVPLDIAQELKAIGFDEPCLYYNSEAISGMGYHMKMLDKNLYWSLLKFIRK